MTTINRERFFLQALAAIIAAGCMACVRGADVYSDNGLMGGTNGLGQSPPPRPLRVPVMRPSVPVPGNPTGERDFAFTNNAFGCITITQYSGSGGEVTIPGTLGGLPVSVIGENAFRNCTNLTTLAVPRGVDTILGQAFRGCSRLTSLSLPETTTSFWGNAVADCVSLTSIQVDGANPFYQSRNGILLSKDGTTLVRYPSGRTGAYTIPGSVTNIGDSAFDGSGAIAELNMPPSVTTLGTWAFAGCTNLTKVGFSPRLKRLGDYSFWGCSLLPEVNLPETLETVGLFAFGHCHGLTTVKIPRSAIAIGPSPFRNSASLTNIVVDGDNPAYCSVDGVLFDKTRTRLIGFPTGRTGVYRVPEGVESIDQSAFRGAGKLTGVTLPASVRFLGYKAFLGCGSVGGFFFEGDAPRLRRAVLDGCGRATVFRQAAATGWVADFCSRPTAIWDPDAPFSYGISDGQVSITRYAHPTETVDIPAMIEGLPVTAIGQSAFQGCTYVTRVAIPDTVKTLGRDAFKNCIRLTDLTLPPGIEQLDSYAFVYCPALPRITIPSKIRSVGQGVFQGCAGLESVTFHDGVTNIAAWAFNGCTGLRTVDLPKNVVSIRDGAFWGCSGLSQVTLPASVVQLGPNAFGTCGGLTAITVNKANPAFASIDGVLFDRSRTRLLSYPAGKSEDYQVPDGVTEIGPSAFEGCGRLVKVVLPASVGIIGNNAFKRCDRLSSINLPPNLSTIANETFRECRSLREIHIPSKVESLGDRAFWHCTKLETMRMTGNAPRIGRDVFADATKLRIHHSSQTQGWDKDLGGIATYEIRQPNIPVEGQRPSLPVVPEKPSAPNTVSVVHMENSMTSIARETRTDTAQTPSAPTLYPAQPVSTAAPQPGTREYYEQKIKGHYALDGGGLVSIVSVRDLPPGLIRYTSSPGVSRRTSSGTSGANSSGARWIEGPVMQVVSNRIAVIGKAVTNASGAVRIDLSSLVALREDRKSDVGNEGRFLAVSDGQYRTVAQSGVEGRLPAYREVSEPSFDEYVAIYQRDCLVTVDPIVSMEIATSAAPGEVGRPLTTFSTSSPPLQALSPEEIQRREEMRIRRDEARRKRGEERKKQAEALARMTPQERERRLRDLNLELIINDSGSPLPIELDEKDIAKLKAAGFDVPGK